MVTPELKKILLTVSSLKYLETSELEVLINYCKIVYFAEGDFLLHQGKKSEKVYILLEGKALIIARTLGKDNITLGTFSEGDFIGEVNLIEKEVSPASVVAGSKVQCLEMTVAYFDMLGTFFPEIKFKINKAITEEVAMRTRVPYATIAHLMSETNMIRSSFFAEVFKTLSNTESITYEASKIDKIGLYSSDFFKCFTEEEYNLLLNSAELIKAPNKCVLIKSNQSESPFFIILHGAVLCSINLHNKIAKLSVLGPLKIFGKYNHHAVPVTYTTCERALLLKFIPAHLTILQEQNPLLWYKFFYAICKSYVALERAANKLVIRLDSEFYNR